MFILKLPGRHSEPCIKGYWHRGPEMIEKSYIKILLTYSYNHRTFKDINIRSRTNNFNMRGSHCAHGIGPDLPKNNTYKVPTRSDVSQQCVTNCIRVRNMSLPCIAQAMEKY